MHAYAQLDEKGVVRYAKEEAGFFPRDARIVCTEIGDGNINWVYRLHDEASRRSVIAKQALPYVRIVGDSWPLTTDRSRIEAEATKVFGSLNAGSVPKVEFHDSTMALTLFEDLSPMKLMRHELMQMKRFPAFPRQMGRFLARNLVLTSDLGMDPEEKDAAVARFLNPQMCKIVEDLVFTDPFFDAKGNNVNPALKREAEECWSDRKARLEASVLKGIYMNRAECLIHGDLHTGSLFIGPGEMRAFDAEFAFYGPAAYDMGCVIGNFLLNCASWETRPDLSPAQVQDYRGYLLAAASDVYREFVQEFRRLWEDDVRPEYREVEGLRERYVETHMRETIGFAGCECVRRTLGLAQVAEMTTVENLETRARAQRLSLRIGRRLLSCWQDAKSPEQFSHLLERTWEDARTQA